MDNHLKLSICGVDSDWQRGQRVPQQEFDQKKDTALKVLCKFNRNDLQKISGVGKEEPKTSREENQNLGLTGHRLSAGLSFLSLLLPRKVFVKETKLARLPASSQWRRVGGRRSREGEGTKCKFDRQTISSLGSGVLKICFQD